MARNYFILLISFLGAVALADYAIVTGLVSFQQDDETAQSPDSSVLYRLAQKYELGVEVELDMDKAIYWYQVAAENGNEEAKSRLIALNISAKTPAANVDERPTKDDNDIDQEAQIISKLLEKQLTSKENVKKTTASKQQKNTKKQQPRVVKEKKIAKPIDEAKLKEITEPTDSTDLSNNSTTLKAKSDEEIDSADSYNEVSTPDNAAASNRQSISDENQIPLALQPERPLNLPSAQKDAVAAPYGDDIPEYVTAYDEETDVDIDLEELSAPIEKNATPTQEPKNEAADKDKKGFNVNPCNGPAAKFMSTCR